MKRSLFMLTALFLLAGCNSTKNNQNPQTLGKSQAPILIEEFADLQCPICSTISPELESIVKNNPELAFLKFYHYPLSVHAYAFLAAQAAECAADQGKFWEYAELIYKNQAELNDDFFYKVADSLDLNQEDFELCLENSTHKEKIQSQMTEGLKRNINGTPTIFVNGQKVEWTTAEDFLTYLKNIKSMPK